MNDKYAHTPRQVEVTSKKEVRLTLECDEMWSFVGKKGNKQWIGLALDRDTREIVGVYVGHRDADGAQALWDSLPSAYRQYAFSYTDFWAAYAQIFPDERHQAVGKDSGQTSHIERLNNTFRQRISRLVRKTLSFSKKIENHIGAIGFFVHHYNASIARSLYECRTTPMTISCILSSFEKQMVLRAKRLIQVRQLRFLRSIFWVFFLPIRYSSAFR